MKGLKSVLCSLAIIGSFASYGQTEQEGEGKIRKNELTFSVNANLLEGVNGLGNSDLGKFNTNWAGTPFGASLGYTYNFSPIAGIWANAQYGAVSGLNDVERFNTSAMSVGVGLRLHPLSFTSSFLNGIYVDGGVGFASYTASRHFVSDDAMMVPQFSGSALAYQGKVGYHKALNDQWKLDVGMSILAVQSDDFDGWSFDGEPADAVLSPSIGITYVFGNGADRSMSEMTAMELINSEMELDGYATKDDLSANAKSNEEVMAELRESLSQFVSEEELDAMIAEILKNSLDTTLVRGELKAVISVYFDFDSYALSSKFQNEIGEFFGTNKDAATRILIVGYADKVGTDAYNFELKQNRIKSVTDLITTKYGVDASMITTQVGDVKLSADSEQYLNRRVDIFVY